MEPIAAALRTKDADELTWDYVATTLIYEYNYRRKSVVKTNEYGKRRNKLKGERNNSDVNGDDNEKISEDSTNIGMATRALAMALGDLKIGNRNVHSNVCEFCSRRGYIKINCFLNPDNPNNKLPPKMK